MWNRMFVARPIKYFAGYSVQDSLSSTFYYFLHFSVTYSNREVQPWPLHLSLVIFFCCYWTITSASSLNCNRNRKFRFSYTVFTLCRHLATSHSFHCRLKQEIRIAESKAEAVLPLLARCRSLSRQQVEQLCWGQQKPPSELLVVPGSLRTQSLW